MKTPAEILAVLPHPDATRSAEHRDIYETIASGINDVHDEDSEENPDAALTWAKSVCEEYIAHARATLKALAGLSPAAGAPVSPDGLKALAPGEQVHVATYHTARGHVALLVQRHGARDGESHYSYTGKHGAGSGHPAKHTAETVKGMLRSHRGIYLVASQLEEMQALGL